MQAPNKPDLGRLAGRRFTTWACTVFSTLRRPPAPPACAPATPPGALNSTGDGQPPGWRRPGQGSVQTAASALGSGIAQQAGLQPPHDQGPMHLAQKHRRRAPGGPPAPPGWPHVALPPAEVEAQPGLAGAHAGPVGAQSSAFSIRAVAWLGLGKASSRMQASNTSITAARGPAGRQSAGR